ncbi:hypothetical protein L798_08502, partial [Zootermopsis nevadensis]
MCFEFHLFQVAWLRGDTQTILTIASHVITKNHRIGVTHSDHRTWFLHIREMKESDRGWYMCQINTDPMKSQIGYLEVVEKGKMSEREGPKEGNIKDLGKQGKLRIRHRRGLMLRFTHISCFYWWCQIHFCLSPAPHSLRITRKKPRNTNYYRLESQYYSRPLPPDTICLQVAASFRSLGLPPDILDYPTSTDMVVREGTNVTLRCAATGSPQPSITWRREGGETIPLGNGQEVASVEGPVFNITRVNRLHMGPYLCIASNGVPPTVSKRIMLIVQFPPMIWIQNQLVGAYEGQRITLECHSEAYPKSINYWTKEKGEIIAQGSKYEPVLLDNAYKVHMKLTIRAVGPADFGSYKCVSKNSLGDTDGSIKLYR